MVVFAKFYSLSLVDYKVEGCLQFIPYASMNKSISSEIERKGGGAVFGIYWDRVNI